MSLLQNACTSMDVDVIVLNMVERLPFYIKRSLVNLVSVMDETHTTISFPLVLLKTSHLYVCHFQHCILLGCLLYYCKHILHSCILCKCFSLV